MSVIGLFFVILGIFGICLGTDAEDIEAGISLICIGFLIPFLFVIIFNLILKKTNKSLPSVENSEYRCDFNENTFSFQEILQNTRTLVEGNYNAFIKVIEKGEFIFLYISNIVAFPVNKKDLVSGNIEDLRALLINRLGERYVYKPKK